MKMSKSAHSFIWQQIFIGKPLSGSKFEVRKSGKDSLLMLLPGCQVCPFDREVHFDIEHINRKLQTEVRVGKGKEWVSRQQGDGSNVDESSLPHDGVVT